MAAGPNELERRREPGPGAPLAPRRSAAVTVWWLVQSPQTLAGVTEALAPLSTPEELARPARLLRQVDREELILGQALRRVMLSALCSDVAPGQWHFCEGANGKPQIASPLRSPSVEFNVSHSRGIIACAAARGLTLGLDLEGVSRIRDLPLLAREVFSPAELDWWLTLPPEPQQAYFYELWTLKEAWAKATALGVGCGFRELSVGIQGEHTARLLQVPQVEEPPDHWTMVKTWLTPTHPLSLSLHIPRSLGIDQVNIELRQVLGFAPDLSAAWGRARDGSGAPERLAIADSPISQASRHDSSFAP